MPWRITATSTQIYQQPKDVYCNIDMTLPRIKWPSQSKWQSVFLQSIRHREVGYERDPHKMCSVYCPFPRAMFTQSFYLFAAEYLKLWRTGLETDIGKDCSYDNENTHLVKAVWLPLGPCRHLVSRSSLLPCCEKLPLFLLHSDRNPFVVKAFSVHNVGYILHTINYFEDRL